jgi:hypothetical protein
VEDAFDASVRLWLEPNDPVLNPYYTGLLRAACGAGTRAYFYLEYPETGPPTVVTQTDASKCSAAVDPVLRFDQAAFDERYGAESFALDEYYALEISENVVPLPAAGWLSLTAVAALAVRARRRPRDGDRNPRSSSGPA